LTAIGCIGLLAFLLISVQSVDWSGSATNLTVKNTEQIGLLLYSKYIIPFELVSVLLLVALVGAIVISKKEAE
ncbi:MAG: NADH-quinone oxidoreductase subunit J, partial [Bacilli bacterium]